MNERRNYYRILHVQPDAPAEIIAASYRSLMTTLRRHPDRGGDHETAAAINQAYDVLSDPARRRAYDRRLGERLPQAQRGRAGAANPATNAQAEPERTRGRCAFCGDPVPAVVDVETRCGASASPQAPLAV
ncbi:MAG: J domain-containing protein, partial [Gammaproteobacteria bacterium]